MEQFGLRVQKKKCVFFRSSLEYLGHVIDSKGLHKSPDFRAILDAPEPTHTSVTLPLGTHQLLRTFCLQVVLLLYKMHCCILLTTPTSPLYAAKHSMG